jgi:hypothetical protein
VQPAFAPVPLRPCFSSSEDMLVSNRAVSGLAAAPGQNPRWACHRGLDLLDVCEWYEFWVLSARYVV